MTTSTDSPPIVVGQTLYREIRQRGKPSEIREAKVLRVGRKYFYIDDYYGRPDDEHPIDRITLKHTNKNWIESNFQLHRDLQSIADKGEKAYLLERFQQYFAWNGPAKENTLEQLRAVAKAAGIDVKEST